METLPDDVVVYKRTPSFNEKAVPPGLLKSHSTRAGTWGRIVVEHGRLRYRILEPSIEEVILQPGTEGVVAPGQEHEVEPIGEVRFHVEFLRQAEESK